MLINFPIFPNWNSSYLLFVIPYISYDIYLNLF